MFKFIDSIPGIIFIPCLLLGLAPFYPMPHVVEKLLMLFQGQLVKPVDIGDLLLHGSAALLALVMVGRMIYLRIK